LYKGISVVWSIEIEVDCQRYISEGNDPIFCKTAPILRESDIYAFSKAHKNKIYLKRSTKLSNSGVCCPVAVPVGMHGGR
jgi:hypothetical protein